MRLFCLLTALIGVGVIVPAAAQKRPPTVQYTEQPPAALDPNFGLPTFGMRNAEQPQQRTQAPVAKPAEKPDAFTAYAPLIPPDPPRTDEQDFFAGAQEIQLPKPRAPVNMATQGYTTMPETPLFTTREDYLTEMSTTSSSTTGMTTGTLGTGDPVDATDALK